MDNSSLYQSLLEQYPTYMTKEQMYRVCHISKKTCLFLLDSGLVPCQDSGKKTRRFKIKTTDVINYLEIRDHHPEYYKPADGFYKQQSPQLSRVLSEDDLLFMREFYENELASWPDVMTVKQISTFTGYGKNSVVRWCKKDYLQHFFIKEKFLVPKAYLLDFLISWNYRGIAVKSDLHKKTNEQIRKLLK